MKMKLGEVINCYSGLVSLDKTYPAKLGYAISRNIKKLESEVRTYNDERIKICECLAVKDEEGKPMMTDDGKGGRDYNISVENTDILTKEIRDLLDSELDVTVQTVPASVLDQCGSSERYDIPSVRDLTILDFMIEPDK